MAQHNSNGGRNERESERTGRKRELLRIELKWYQRGGRYIGMIRWNDVTVRACMATERRRIVLPPGATLNRITRFLVTREAHARFVEPIIRDMQVEYCDELAAGHIRHARWIAVRGHLLVLPNWSYAWIARTVKRMFSSL